MKFKSLLLVTALLISVNLLNAQQTSANAAAANGPDVAPAQPERFSTGDSYKIGPRDVLTIRVTAGKIVPELSLDAVEVNECGRIPLASVYQEEQNDIQAAGKTRDELGEDLRKFYLKYKRNPQVVVTVKEYNSQPVAINGAVVKPGQFQMRRPVRLLELLEFYAGGPTDKAGGRIQIGRMPAFAGCVRADVAGAEVIDNNSAPQFLSLKLDDTLHGVEQANPYLQPGDVITLPEAKEAYVVGNVLRPGSVFLRDEKTTLSRALAMSGGLMPDTQKDKVLIHRPDPTGGSDTRELVVDLKAVESHKQPDVTILPNDIVEVQIAGGKRLLRTLMGSVVPSVGQLPTSVIR